VLIRQHVFAGQTFLIDRIEEFLVRPKIISILSLVRS